jgi:hypothetical protein
MLFHATIITCIAFTKPISDPINGFNRISGQFALPYHQSPPAKVFELSYASTVSFNIFGEFFLPEIDIALGRACVFTSWMSVPITAVDKNGRMKFWKDEIRATW